jgi:hypothetical protein
MALAPDDPRHGTDNGYRHHRCRCAACRAAHAEWHWEARELRDDQGLAADDPRHGRYSTYVNHACRCDACRAANATVRANARAAGRT